jgi:hypothetical protein
VRDVALMTSAHHDVWDREWSLRKPWPASARERGSRSVR